MELVAIEKFGKTAVDKSCAQRRVKLATRIDAAIQDLAELWPEKSKKKQTAKHRKLFQISDGRAWVRLHIGGRDIAVAPGKYAFEVRPGRDQGLEEAVIEALIELRAHLLDGKFDAELMTAREKRARRNEVGVLGGNRGAIARTLRLGA
jgi:hypothetical protein